MGDRTSGRWRWHESVIVAAVILGGLAFFVVSDAEIRVRSRQNDELRPPGPGWLGLPPWFRALRGPASRLSGDVRLFLTIASVGLTIVTLRPGRLLGPSGWPGPGVAATAAGAAILALDCFGAVMEGLFPMNFGYFYRKGVIFSAEPRLSGAILGAWAVLALSGRWKPRRDWPDRLGLWVGLGWTAYMVFDVMAWPILWG